MNTTAPIVVAGGSSAAGIAVASALVSAGFPVMTVGSDAGRIGAAAALTGGAVPRVCDLADPAAVQELADTVRRGYGAAGGLIHLVGGWRGGKSLSAQVDADWDFLHRSVLTTLRNTSRAFYDDIGAHANGRIAIVSSTAVTSPTPGNANYAAVKAAAETWVMALAAGLAADAVVGAAAGELLPSGGLATADAGATTAQAARAGDGPAAVVLVVKALVDDAMRAASPERKFPGFTDVAALGQTVVGLFSTPAGQLNGARIVLN
ncbi:SDR family NAD(P)-dependent oxidoreductase [Arthrobacter sp. A2-55]|uniref:SDR family NAD(P)-dependent oxidoreductase n=1 Tax=Arthrobacter sp. A2-55 TaxID=2897337 RepID=UPI0021CDE198|nr:SDR family NAD(P)-dependent oxidoreductase [Arthrobacter sp. A2-55]MCU6482363.1 SDR family NAD(P)-dependent oxidoreductase [Arthrobacter sp. A2-55]